jgi:ribosome-binding factor A
MGSGRQRRGRETPSIDIALPEDDAVRAFFGPDDIKRERKLRQLCREAERTLAVALGSCADAALRELTLVAVEPAPDAARLCATVAPGAPGADLADLQARLERVRGSLRAELAQALQRKRTPELTFAVLPAGEGTP